MKKISQMVVFLAILQAGRSAICGQALPSKPVEHVILGFLDDAREEMVNFAPGVARQRVIRPAFERTLSGWQEVDASSVPSHTKWTIAFDGRNLGKVESRTFSNGDSIRLRTILTPFQTILTPPASVPSVGSPSQDFAGILGSPDTKFRRPLVVVSKPYFRDPDNWKRTKLPDKVGALVRETFRHEYSHVDRCKDEEIAERDWKFPDSALVFPVAYASDKNSFLVEASLNAGECGYVEDPDDASSAPWFFISSDGTVRRIGSFMSLLDAGDYDNDGRSEVLFFLSQGENTDGFVLFDASFKTKINFTWSYH